MAGKAFTRKRRGDVAESLAAKGLRFIGGFRTRKYRPDYGSKYMPHQGEQERARRKRKMEADQ